jgi:hypothetical protein
MGKILLIAGSVLMLIASCTSTQTAIAPSEDDTDTEELVSSEFSFGFDIQDYRIIPNDAFFSIENEVPSIFQPDSTLISAASRNAGFRIQLISSQDMREVEDLRRVFNQWMFDEIHQYETETYILFRQPFFRLRVGNFRSRSEAIKFNNVVKRKFPGSWVVHDQIDLDNITRKVDEEGNSQ